jgi:exopolysaccharide biosynthesis polyprenyl glycosylphosphotransferase
MPRGRGAGVTLAWASPPTSTTPHASGPTHASQAERVGCVAEMRLDGRTLMLPARVADEDYVGNGIVEQRPARRAGHVAKASAKGGLSTRRPSKLRVGATVMADAIALVVSAILAAIAIDLLADAPLFHRLFSPFASETRAGIVFFVCLMPFWLAALWAFGLYREPGRSIGGFNLGEALSGLTALTAASWLLLVGLVFVQGAHAPIAILIAFWLLAIMLVPLARWVGRLTVWRRSAFQERVLIIGAGEVGHTIAAKMNKHPEYRVKLVGFLDDGEPRRNGDGGPPVPVIGALGDLDRVVVAEQVDRVIVAFSRARHNDFLRVVRACADSGVKVNIVPRLFEVVSSRALVDDVEGIPLLDVGHVELSRFNMGAKRTFDLILGGLLSIPILPVLAAVAIAVRFDSRGPVFYRQERMGRAGRTFRIFKFRSMYVGADLERKGLADQNDYSGPMFKMRQDPRVTRVGAFLRRWSIDELPQIINVMKGEMSLVGPRPLWVEEAKQCRGWTQKRLDITPGITGLWQVLGRTNIPFDEMVKLDYMYVTGWSLSWDIKLLLQTVPAVLEKRGAC